MHFMTFICLILLLATTTATIINYDPHTQLYNVFAQDEDEKEEEEEEQQQEEESGDDSSSSKDEEKEEEEGSSEEEQEKEPVEDIQPVTTEAPIVNLTNDQLLNPVPVQNTAVETETEIATPPIEEFNATCSCFTNSNLSNPPPPTPLQPDTQSQIPVSSNNIVDSNSLGQVKDGNYTGYYIVANLLDNKIDDTSFWSQAGNSGFTIQLDNTLNDYQVCSMELNNIHDPKGIPYFLDIGVSKNYTGVIDQVNEKIQFDKCIRDMNQIVMMFNKNNLESTDFISIGEIKLFGSKIGAEETTIIPPVLEPVSEEKPITTPAGYENATRINIEDSTAEIDIKNSTVTFKFDPMTATFVQHS